MQLYNHNHKNLIYIKQSATPEFWDDHWQVDSSLRKKITKEKNTFVTNITKKYIKPKDGIILEGGCGTGIHVAALQENGYRCIGIDYAQHTVASVNTMIPEIDVRLGDVRKLEFDDDYFAGYWSLGVIEHFWEGYLSIQQEIKRVLQPGGYLFLTFPYMSPLRKIKVRLNLYDEWKIDHAPPAFYQFALNHSSVIKDFTQQGFKLVKSQPMLGLRAAKDEIGFLRPLLEKLHTYDGSSPVVKGIKVTLSKLLTPFSGHLILLIFKKNKSL